MQPRTWIRSALLGCTLLVGCNGLLGIEEKQYAADGGSEDQDGGGDDGGGGTGGRADSGDAEAGRDGGFDADSGDVSLHDAPSDGDASHDVSVEPSGDADASGDGADGTGCSAESNGEYCARLGKTCGSVTDLDNCAAARTATCGTCTSPETCDTKNVCCLPETDPAFCTRLGTNCGSVTAADNCGATRTNVACGSCAGSQVCGASNVCGCTAESNSQFCSRQGKNCGSLSAADNCGANRVVSCGSCTSPQTCGSDNVCACVAESNTAFCSRQGKNCGSLSAADDCGANRTANCGSCTLPQTCGSNNVCACVPESDQAFCGRLGKNCGNVTDFNNCGASRSNVACGSCTLPKTCGVDNVCACVPESNAAFCARLGTNCGSVTRADNCGTTRTGVACGSCTSPQVCSGSNACVNPPSCTGLASTCGPNGNASCCGANVVTGGTYNRSNDANYPATVSDFRLDNYEITVGRFRKFVAAYSQTMTPAGAGKNPNNVNDPGWNVAYNASLPTNGATLATAVKCDATYQTWTDTAGANENRPINCIDWYEAYAFCIWDGGRLPTEAEWNYAAAGGSLQRQYPWGATAPDCTYANFSNGGYCVSPPSGSTNNVGSESPKGDGYWGQSDLAGNVWEWNLDWYASPYASSCNNCAAVASGTYRIGRGGNFGSGASLLLSSVRNTDYPSSHSLTFGARCARIP